MVGFGNCQMALEKLLFEDLLIHLFIYNLVTLFKLLIICLLKVFLINII